MPESPAARARYTELLEQVKAIDGTPWFDLDSAVGALLAPPTDEPPFIIIELLTVGAVEIARAFPTYDEGDAHIVGTALARLGSKVWVIDLSDHDQQRYLRIGEEID